VLPNGHKVVGHISQPMAMQSWDDFRAICIEDEVPRPPGGFVPQPEQVEQGTGYLGTGIATARKHPSSSSPRAIVETVWQ